MQQHGSEMLKAYCTTMELNEVTCIKLHLNSVHYPLRKRQKLHEFLRLITE